MHIITETVRMHPPIEPHVFLDELVGWFNAAISCSSGYFQEKTEGTGYAGTARMRFAHRRTSLRTGRLVTIRVDEDGEPRIRLRPFGIHVAYLESLGELSIGITVVNADTHPMGTTLIAHFRSLASRAAEPPFSPKYESYATVFNRVTMKTATSLGVTALGPDSTPVLFSETAKFLIHAFMGTEGLVARAKREWGVIPWDWYIEKEVCAALCGDRYPRTPYVHRRPAENMLSPCVDSKETKDFHAALQTRAFMMLSRDNQIETGQKTVKVRPGLRKTVTKTLRKQGLIDTRGKAKAAAREALKNRFAAEGARPAAQRLTYTYTPCILTEQFEAKRRAMSPPLDRALEPAEISERCFSSTFVADGIPAPAIDCGASSVFYGEVEKRNAVRWANEDLQDENSALRSELADLAAKLDEAESKLRRAASEMDEKDALIDHLTHAVTTKGGSASESDGLNTAARVLASGGGSLTVLEALEAASVLAPDALVVLPTAWRSAGEVPVDFRNGERLLRLLMRLATVWLPAFLEKGDAAAKQVFTAEEYSATETKLLRTSRLGEMRRFRWRGVDRPMLRHLRLGSAQNRATTVRIYFDCIPEEKKVVLGWCGEHLPIITPH